SVGRHRTFVFRSHSHARLSDGARPLRCHRGGHARGQSARRSSLRRRRSAHPVGGEVSDVRGGMWTLTWRRFRRSKLAVIALIYVGFVGILAISAPFLAGSKSTPIPFG